MVVALQQWVDFVKKKIPYTSKQFTPSTAEIFESSARRAHHLSAYLKAGLPALSVQEYLHSEEDSESHTHDFLNVLWKKAQHTGISPASFYATCAAIFEEVADLARWAQSVEAGPRAAQKLIMALPVVALAGASLLGNGALIFLLTQPMGWFLVILAISLMWVAKAWGKSLVEKATTISWQAGMHAEFCGLFLRAGYPPVRALAEAREVFTLIPSGQLSVLEESDVQQTLTFASRQGIPATGLLESLARAQRSKQRQRVRADIEALSVKLIVPLGVCVLPAFIAVGVIPVVVSMFSSTAVS